MTTTPYQIRDLVNLPAKNFFINGAFDFRQRSSGTTNMSAGNAYYFDRWQCRYDANGAWTGTPTISTTTAPTVATQNALLMTGTPSASTSEFIIQQRIESANAALLAGQTINVSIWIKTTAFTQVGFRFLGAGAKDNFSSYSGDLVTEVIKTLTPDGTWRQLSTSVTLPTSNTVNGFELRFEFLSATGTGSSQTTAVGQAMVLPGATVPPFYYRAGDSIQAELAMCQRYYEKSYDDGIAPGTASASGALLGLSGTNASGTQLAFSYPFAVNKRAAPSVTIYDNAGNSGKVSTVNTAGTSTDNQTILATTTSTKMVRTSITTSTNCGILFHYTADSEL